MLTGPTRSSSKPSTAASRSICPGGTDADVDARTVNGRIESSLPLTLKEYSRRSLKGTLGSGGRGLSLGTVNGSITLKSGA